MECSWFFSWLFDHIKGDFFSFNIYHAPKGLLFKDKCNKFILDVSIMKVFSDENGHNKSIWVLEFRNERIGY